MWSRTTPAQPTEEVFWMPNSNFARISQNRKTRTPSSVRWSTSYDRSKAHCGCSFSDYLNDVYGNLAMVNYPYESTFLAPLPAYPVTQFCSYLNASFSGTQLIDVLSHYWLFSALMSRFVTCSNFRPYRRRYRFTRTTLAKRSASTSSLPTTRAWELAAGTISPAPKWWCRCAVSRTGRETCSRRRNGISPSSRIHASSNGKFGRISRWLPPITAAITSSKVCGSAQAIKMFILQLL